MISDDFSGLKLWDQWNASSAPNYPQEKVVQFCLRNFPNPDIRLRTRALDWGCGSGVNTAFLCREGFRVTATDLSSVAIENTRRRLEGLGLRAVLLQQDLRELDLEDSSVDLVICVGVFESVGIDVASEALMRLPVVLRPRARGMFLFAEEHDSRFARDEPHRLYGYSRNEVEELFRGFSRVFIDQYITTFAGGSERECHWLVTIEN
jgi:SAM-dependent methyltransferase